ncbi:MAG: hypothetical protein CL910_01650 [Deltaproteobacteria bacterium]|jgi:hypothetical protein|nr:hypothetical protein [Deltaproteobacteria bacterium]
MSERWNDAFLNEMRLAGDRPADSMVDKYLEGAEVVDATDRLMGTLFGPGDASQTLPPELRQLVGPSEEAARSFDADAVRTGQKVFRQHGPEIMMVLACYSLPAAYAARRGVQVLRDTGRLVKNPELRLLDTAQILTKMMSPNALEADHPGIVAARKVRLIHAVVRHRIANDPKYDWDPEQRDPDSDIPLGLPINQEDLAGTLLVFSYAILDGLDTLGIEVDGSHREAYMATWHYLAPILGLIPEMIPEDFEDAGALMQRIHERQHAASTAGREMTSALLDLMEGFLPFFLKTVPPSLIRFMMKKYPRVPEYIGVPRHPITEALLPIAIHAAALVDRVLTGDPVVKRLYRTVSFRLIRELIRSMKGHRHEDFAIPPELEREWMGRRARSS